MSLKRLLQIVTSIVLLSFCHGSVIQIYSDRIAQDIEDPTPRLKTWPSDLDFRVSVRENPSAYLAFVNVRATGTSKDENDFKKLMEEEIQRLQERPSLEGPREMIITRQFTTVAMRCGHPPEGHPNWSFELSLQVLKTLGGLTGLNGLKEFYFEVREAASSGVYQRCEIYLRNPWPRTAETTVA